MVPLPSRPVERPLRVVVLTCGDLGIEVANALRGSENVHVVAVLSSPWPRRRLTLRGKIRHVVRTQGIGGLFHVLGAHLLPSPTPAAHEVTALDPSIALVEIDDFHTPGGRTAFEQLDPDLGVVAGTYILRDGVFDIPRYGSINLHSGKTPEYRGAAPGFWELYNGESTVGITIHRVAAALDAGDVLRQELFPLDRAPNGDPMDYVERYRRDVLRPNGIRMLTHVVREIAMGGATPLPQNHGIAKTYRSPDHKAIRELRSRVRSRRRVP
jgi:methionyl-tRNA formyltransferase